MNFLKKNENGDGKKPTSPKPKPAAKALPKVDLAGVAARIRGLVPGKKAKIAPSEGTAAAKDADGKKAVKPGKPAPSGSKLSGILDALRSKAGSGKAGPKAKAKPGEKQIADAKKAIQTPADISRPEVGVLAFGKKKTAVGLQWLPPEEDVPLKARLAELTQHAQSDDTQMSATYRFYTDTRKTGFMGVGGPELGHATGMRALVTMLAPQITGTRWVGAFQISPSGDHWWIGSIRDGKVFNDQIVNSRHQAEEILLSDLQAPDWTAVFAPADWGISGSRTEELHEVVDLRLGEKLRSSTPVKDNLPRAILAIAVVTVAASAYGYVQHQKAEKQRELEEMRRRAEASVTYEPEDLPWFKVTDINTFIKDCTTKIQGALLMVPGWENQPLSCAIKQGEGSIATGWARNGGKTTWLRSLIAADRPVPVFATDYTSASWIEGFSSDIAPGDAMSVTPWDPAMMESRIRERFLHYDLPINIRPASGNMAEATNQVVFNAHEVRISSEIGFSNFGDMLKDIPALVPDALVYSPATGIWDLTFSVNHPPIFPPEMR